MINISTQNPNSTKSFRSKWIDGFTVGVRNTSNAGGLSSAPNDFEQLTLKGTLRRGGRELEIFNHTLKLLVLMSHLKSATYDFLNSGGASFIDYGTVGTVEYNLVPLRFDFGGPLNLIDSDEFVLEWTLNTGFFVAGSGINSSASYIQIDETETTEVEYFVPITRTKVIEGSQDNPTWELGDNIMQVNIFNYDKFDYLSTSQVIKNVSFKSDKVNKNDNIDELITKAISYYPTPAEAALRKQNFIIYEGKEELDGVSLNLSLNSANVTSSKNYIAWRTFYTDDWLTTRAGVLESNLQAKSDKKGSFNPNLLERDAI